MMARPNPCGAGLESAVSSGMRAGEFGHDFRGRIGAAVIHHHDFVRHIAQAKFGVKMFDCRGNAAFLIARRDDNGK